MEKEPVKVKKLVKKRVLVNEALLKSVGVDYTSFNSKELAEVLKKSLVYKSGVTKVKYKPFATAIKDFRVSLIEKIVEFSEW
jgi:hypothetical protein